MDEDRNIIVVDVMGTPDECRFTYKGLPVSKEVAREFYRKTSWYSDTEKEKKKTGMCGRRMLNHLLQPFLKDI